MADDDARADNVGMSAAPPLATLFRAIDQDGNGLIDGDDVRQLSPTPEQTSLVTALVACDERSFVAKMAAWPKDPDRYEFAAKQCALNLAAAPAAHTSVGQRLAAVARGIGWFALQALIVPFAPVIALTCLGASLLSGEGAAGMVVLGAVTPSLRGAEALKTATAEDGERAARRSAGGWALDALTPKAAPKP